MLIEKKKHHRRTCESVDFLLCHCLVYIQTYASLSSVLSPLSVKAPLHASGLVATRYAFSFPAPGPPSLVNSDGRPQRRPATKPHSSTRKPACSAWNQTWWWWWWTMGRSGWARRLYMYVRGVDRTHSTNPTQQPVRTDLAGVEDVQAVGHDRLLQLVRHGVPVAARPLPRERLRVEDPPREGRGAVRAGRAAQLPLLPVRLLRPLLVLLLGMGRRVSKELVLHLLDKPALGRQLVQAGAGQHEAAAGGQQLRGWVGDASSSSSSS